MSNLINPATLGTMWFLCPTCGDLSLENDVHECITLKKPAIGVSHDCDGKPWLTLSMVSEDGKILILDLSSVIALNPGKELGDCLRMLANRIDH